MTNVISCNLYIYIDKNKVLNKTEVLKLKNFYISYFCKNDICTEVNTNFLKQFVEIPDDKGNIKRYISSACTYQKLKLNECSNRICVSYNNEKEECKIFISYKCNSDSQCLTNKCIDGMCIYNEENPTEFCTDVYINSIFGRRSYRHCGKAIGDVCKRKRECASKECLKYLGYSYCGIPSRPSDSDFVTVFAKLLFLTIAIIFIFIILCLGFCIKLIIKNKNRKIKD
ncbi:hypothetical protein BCR36DRAFT_397246 [Piromyces finnis]|uniref:Uncharacterized protein n=1 Tax=Piromyces finnis TaxID=1754191 RepID=A0A1Y1VAD8_9FUNG|nr:hypothetical protein BCR36DRAFT_397246 [Piromyces finnis]|eukprot:ORX51030.1 hypothetical protein BCR36DRAFT_397246 [Piromyces finnis]